MVDEAEIRAWFEENGLQVAPANMPNTDFSLSFRMPSGLQLLIQRPHGRFDFCVVSCGVGIDSEQQRRLQPNAREFLRSLRHDLLLKGVVFQFNQPGEGVIPTSVGVARELYDDGLSKNLFMKSVGEVQEAALLVILTVQQFATD